MRPCSASSDGKYIPALKEIPFVLLFIERRQSIIQIHGTDRENMSWFWKFKNKFKKNEKLTQSWLDISLNSGKWDAQSM